MKKWKVIKETNVSPSKWFPILQHTVELPSGVIVDDFYISNLANVALVLPLTSRNEVVLVKQYKHAVGEVVIELPAGVQQEGKTLKETALTELEEEVGIKTRLNNLIYFGRGGRPN